MDSQETKSLTVEEIDIRLAENGARLETIGHELEKKNKELGRARGFQLPTVGMIRKAARALRDERDELTAAQEFLTSERERIQQAIAQKAAEDAAAEYERLYAQRTSKAIEVIKSLCDAQSQLIEYEKNEMLMEREAGIAGGLVNPVRSGTIKLHTGEIGRHIDQSLLGVKSYNGKEKLEQAGIDIPDYYQELEKAFGARLVSVNTGSPSPTVETNTPSPPAAGTFEAGFFKATGLAPEAPAEPGADSFEAGLRRAAGLPAE